MITTIIYQSAKVIYLKYKSNKKSIVYPYKYIIKNK
jgi:hypothetical protein